MSDLIHDDQFNDEPEELITNITQEMRQSFLDYSMSVIVSRALPDVRDGMKPVHRRILYAMENLGMQNDKPYRKSAMLVGEVMGKYHPHGDSAIYSSMVRMAQDFSYRYPLVQGQGNFGSIDGDEAAAMRYTEARMSKIATEMMRDINKNTVDYMDNYDASLQEPSVLPARFPQLIVNGGMGIAVGMATNIPPHNLSETIDACIAVMENPEITTRELMENYIFGPDFPTGAYILGRSGIKKAFETGRGSVVVRSKTRIEDMDNGKKRIIVYEIPYSVNKAKCVEKIADLVREKIIEGITDLRDESNRDGIRIVIELRKDVQADVILNQLYRLTPLQSNFGVDMLTLVNNQPKLLGIKDMLTYYIEHQVEVIVRKTQYELDKAIDRAHLLEGFIIALDHIDRIIAIIRGSHDDSEVIAQFGEEFGLSEIQSKAILDMRLRRLTGLEREKIEEEYQQILLMIDDYKDILANHSRVVGIIKEDLLEIKNRSGDERRSEIIEGVFDMEDEDLIPEEEIIVTMTLNGYIKRNTIDTFSTQNRGGRGIKGMGMNDDDTIEKLITMNTHDYLSLFTNKGKVYRIKGYRIPEASRTAKGIPLINLIDLDKDEKVVELLWVRDVEEIKYVVFGTKNGLVKRTKAEEFMSIRSSGKIAIKLAEDDELIAVKMTTGDNEILMASSNGRAVRFKESDVRPSGRNSMGVKGINVDGGYVVGMTHNASGKYILSVTENGYGKKTPTEQYRLSKRGAKGVYTIRMTDRNGPLVGFRAVEGDEDVLIVTDLGVIIRISLESVGVYSRVIQGVKLINVDEDAIVSSLAVIPPEEDEEENSD